MVSLKCFYTFRYDVLLPEATGFQMPVFHDDNITIATSFKHTCGSDRACWVSLHAKLSRHQRVKCSIEPIQLTLKHIFLQQVSGERHLNSGCSMETYSQEYGVQQHSNPHHLWLCLTQSKRNDNGNPTLHLLVFCCNFRSALLASSVSPGIVAILKGLICHPHIIRSEY